MREDLKISPQYDGFLFLAEAVRNPPILRPHHHVELELNVVARGEITYVVGHRRYTFGQRSLLWMFPSVEHQLVDRSPDAEYYVAVFKPGMIQRACTGPRYQPLKEDRHPEDPVPCTVLDPESFGLLCREMESLMEEGIDAEVLNREAGFGLSPEFSFRHGDPDWLNAGLHHLLLFSWRLQSSRPSGLPHGALHPGVRRALDRLADPDHPGDLKTLEKDCGVSAAYLSRIFHRQLGVSLSAYRRSLRMERFWEIYHRDSGVGLLQAVYTAGFGSYAQFFRDFTKAYGAGPRNLLQKEV